MNYDWLQGVYDDYRRGDPETVAGVRALQRKVQIGCACGRDVAVLKGLDSVHGMTVGQDRPDLESSVFISDSLLRTLLDLIVQARRPPSVNLLTAGTSPMRRHGGTGQGVGPTISGYYGYGSGPFFGATHGGSVSRGGAAMRATSAPATMSSPSHASSFRPGGGGHGHGFRHSPGGGFASWVGPWGGWPGDCYLDVYGRIWCWGPYGWQVVG